MAAAAARPLVGGLENHAKISPALAGTILVSELGCTACHATSRTTLLPKSGPDLSTAGARIRSEFLHRFIANPSASKPGTTMPDMLSHLPKVERDETASALAQYVASLGTKPMVFAKPTPDAIKRGKALYHSVGCVACHSPEQAVAGSVPLGPLAEKYSLASLTQFLEDPLAVRPGGRMPDMRLDHFEAVDIASYLLREQSLTTTFVPDAKLIERGKALFTQHNCHACHRVAGEEMATQQIRSLDRARLDRGCLSESRGAWPHFPFAAKQRVAIQSALTSDAAASPEQRIEIELTRFNCIACHRRGDYGGVAVGRDSFFTGVDENLGEQGRIPPPLTGVGAKLKRDWLRDVVVNGATARPYLHTRMPKFGAANTELLVALLKKSDPLPAAKIPHVRDARLARQTGRELAGSKGFNCVACHTFREKSSAPIRALDLATMSNRLEENWFHRYMTEPQRFSPLTIMPGFWPDGKSPLPDVLSGDAGLQRDALWRYLSEGPEAGEPRGLVLEPLVIAVADEAVMLRRNYPGIGKRGIGVGYPSGISLSFDAGQMRLASMWSGGFIEASGVWRGQGSGQARVLGRDTITFPEGPAFAVLESATTPWPTNTARQAEGFQFKGYTLEARQRPTFRYQFGALNIDDRFLDVKDASGNAHFERTVSFSSGSLPEGLHLRLAADRSIVARSARDFNVGKTMRLRLSSPGIIRETADGHELLFPVTQAVPITIEYRW